MRRRSNLSTTAYFKNPTKHVKKFSKFFYQNKKFYLIEKYNEESQNK